MRRSFWKLSVLCVLALGCSSKTGSNTVVGVVVYSDLDAPGEIDQVQLEVLDSSVAKGPRVQNLDSGTGKRLLVQFAMVPASDALGFDIRVTGLLRDRKVVSQEFKSGAVSGQSRALVVYLGRACQESGTGAAVHACVQGQTTCQFGRCIDLTISPEALVSYDPKNPPAAPQDTFDAGPDGPTTVVDTGADIDSAQGEVVLRDGGRDAAADVPMDAPGPDSPSDRAPIDVAVDGLVIVDVAGTGGIATGTGGAGGMGGGIAETGGVSGTGGTVGGSGGAGGTTVPVTCLPLTKPDNGDVVYLFATPGSTASYSCASSYVLSGEKRVECKANGEWSSAPPKCLRDCGEPPAAPAGATRTVTATTEGSQTTYACPTGYAPPSTVLTCQATGLWGTAPTCTPVTCPSLTDPSHGHVNASGTVYKSTATYSCDSGYKLTDSTARTCEATGDWSGSAPGCPPVDCGKLDPPANGTVTTSPDTTFNSTATYKCNKGFVVVGGTPRQCQAEGNWSGTAAACEVNCGTPPVAHQGGVIPPTGGTGQGAVANYLCYGGMTLYPKNIVSTTCQPDGNWSGATDPPTCVCDSSGYPGWGNACQASCPSGTPVEGIQGCDGRCYEAMIPCGS